MYSETKSLAFHKVSYIFADSTFSSSSKSVSDFFDLVNSVEFGNKTPKQLHRILELWKGHIPRGRVSDNTRTIFYSLKNFLSDNELEEYIVSDYLKARIKYYRNFSVDTKEDQLEYLHNIVEAEGLLSCFAHGMSRMQLDFFKQDAKYNYLLSSLVNIAADNFEINSITPTSELKRYGLKTIGLNEYNKHPGAFREFIEHFIDEILFYKKLSNQFSNKLPIKFRLAKKVSSSADHRLLKKAYSDPGWLFYNHPSNLMSYNLKNSIVRRLYA